MSLEVLPPTFLSSYIVRICTVRNGSCSVSNKAVLQGDIEAAPRYFYYSFCTFKWLSFFRLFLVFFLPDIVLTRYR
jgi:hypothetical protein